MYYIIPIRLKTDTCPLAGSDGADAVGVVDEEAPGALAGVPEAARTHLPRYPLVSATLMGRLADALHRALASAQTVGSSMIVVDALDDGAASFYAAHGFVRLPESLRLVLPMRMVEHMVGSS